MSPDQLQEIADRFPTLAPQADYWSLRVVDEETERFAVRQGIAEPSFIGSATGAMVTVVKAEGVGYGATGDLTPAGLRAAAERAIHWAGEHARLGLFDAEFFPRSDLRRDYSSQIGEPWESLSSADKLGLLRTHAMPSRSTGASWTGPPGSGTGGSPSSWSQAVAVGSCSGSRS
jgi:predicted Zn-dependent protease